MAIHETSMNSSTNPSGSTTTTSKDSVLPSALFAHYSDGGWGTSHTGEQQVEDTAALIQNVLSALANQRDLVEHWKVETEGDLSDWMWKSLSSPGASNQDDLSVIGKAYAPELVEYEWWMGTQFLAVLLPKLSPFEIHSIATDSSVFSDGSKAHWMLCLLIASYSLRGCPAPLEQRWKRWQSLTCESIRMFQNYGIETGYHALSLWTNHMVPACQHVIRQLPAEALHLGLLSGLIGTTTTLVMKECDRLRQVHQNVLLTRGLLLLKSLREIVHEGGETEEWIWRNPWRSKASFPKLSDEDVALESYKDNISWWNQGGHCHDKVAGMDTSWNPTGLSLLAVMAYDDRPRTLSFPFIWKTWFPHVAILFKAPHEYSFLDGIPCLLLEKLTHLVPERSLPAVTSCSHQVDAPYETFQLLSNRIMIKPPKKKKLSKKEVELASQARSQRIVGLMKSLLSRYPVINQIKIVRKIVHDCPHPGLQAKFMDLLRPIIFEEESTDAFWSYIGSFIKDLLSHVDDDNRVLIRLTDLINKVEVYVAGITIIQLWCMVKGRLPKKIKGSQLGKFYKILKQSIASWMSDPNTMPPDEYYRLYLLEGALQQVVQILDAARQKRRQAGVDDCSLSSSSIAWDTLELLDPSKSKNDDEDETVPQGVATIVGDADIFS